MIVCYHKARKKFYVIRDNTKAGRKFLHYGTFEECEAFAGPDCTLSRSALAAMGWAAYMPHPTRSDESSDAGRGSPATTIATPGAGRRIERDPDT